MDCDKAFQLTYCKYLFMPENDIDGDILLGLSDSMIEKLFPTMKLQVSFIKSRRVIIEQAKENRYGD